MIFRRSLPGVNRATRRAGMRMAAPVRGFRTERARRRATSKTPNPTSFTFSPVLSERETFSMSAPRTRSTSALVRPESLATRATTSARFMTSGGLLGVALEQLLGPLEDEVAPGRAFFLLGRLDGHARLHAVAVDGRALGRRVLGHRDEQAAPFRQRNQLLQGGAPERPLADDRSAARIE